MKIVRKLSGAFTGGALGALLDSFNIWFMGVAGISDLTGITMKTRVHCTMGLQTHDLGWYLDAFAPYSNLA